MNALELLKTDHRKVEALFRQVEATDDEATHRQLFEQIKKELDTHTYIEETVLYPQLQEHEELKDLVLEAYEEHKQVKVLLREISALADGSDRFDAKLKVMSENVEHHVEEEETEMFPKIEEICSPGRLAEIGTALQAAKADFQTQSATRSTGTSAR